MNKFPLVSVIIPTKNSEYFLASCLQSIKNQTDKNFEIIIVDNNSTDNTVKIAKKYTYDVYNCGPERSMQRNFGAKRARGKYLLFIDSDMELSSGIISNCIKRVKQSSDIKGVIISEESFGEGFWADCKKLEKSFYVGVKYIEGVRFIELNSFNIVSGFDEKMVSGEDWDLTQRLEKIGKLARTNDFIYHNEGKINLLETIKKKYYYANRFSNYLKKNRDRSIIKKQIGIFSRYGLFLRRPMKLFKNPILGIGVIFMKTCEFGFGGVGYIISKIKL